MKMHFTYTNYRGETDKREVIVHHIRHISTDWHPEKQWIMTALDVNKNAMRDFAMRDMSDVHPTPTLFLMSADVLRQLMGRLNEIQSAVNEVGTGPVDELTRLTGEAKGLVNSIMKGADKSDGAFLPLDITPEIREVLRMQPWKVDTIAGALRASGHDIGKRHDDAMAAVKFLLLHFVLEHGKSWQHAFRTFVDNGVSDKMKYTHTLPGYGGDDNVRYDKDHPGG